MITETEKFQVAVPDSDCRYALVNTVLLLNLQEWEIEELETFSLEKGTESGSFRCSKHGSHINVVVERLAEKETMITIVAEGETQDNVDERINAIKRSFLFALHEQNSVKLFDALQRIPQQYQTAIRDVTNKKLKRLLDKSQIDSAKKLNRSLDKPRVDSAKVTKDLGESSERHRDPIFHYTQAISILKFVVPDIEQTEALYWEKILPFSVYTGDMLKGIGAEEELNLALAIGLDDLYAARAKFMLMSLWLTKQVVEGKIKYQTESEVQNLPYLRPFAREIIGLTKKHLLRDHQNLHALRMQKAAYQYLQNLEGVGETEHAIAKIRSLIKAGFIEIQKETPEEENSVKRRKDGKALEEEVRELLRSMGLKATTTRTTGDGGIDIIAYSDSPLFSGKYVVQCKDWAGSVGESVIRDLYGVVTAESANKGILITTGTITKSAQKFAEGKPLELIDGQELNKLLQKFNSKGG
jgi:restriction endonuclease Mrr